ncbi:MAG: thiamine-phosphate kinase [Candidatus Melainabacteria bacterium]|nr:thiamine-phosphate kinase [Candidatus Melainabacteria bacterium]
MPTEQEILSVIRKIITNSNKYLFDDAAIIEKNLVATIDTLVENTHFTLKDYIPEEIGWKALALNLSDIASMGAKPLYALIALSLPKSINLNWIKKFYTGINSCAKKYKTQIIGGNLARSKEINITITILGKLVTRNIGKRSNAKAGDLVFATGSFGDSACGFLLLKEIAHAHIGTYAQKLINIHKKPTPQINIGQQIVSLIKRAALMDASDGLADCLIQIAKESKVKIVTYEDKIPVSQNLTKTAKILKKPLLNLVLYGGEDYQLVGTASKTDCKKLKKINKVKIIGEVLKGSGAYLKQSNNKLVKLEMKKAFKHFI